MKRNVNYLRNPMPQNPSENLYSRAVKTILDYGVARAKTERPHLTHDEVLNEIADACRLISKSYKPGSSRPDYSTWQRQLAYVFVETVANATAFQIAFKTHRELSKGIREGGSDSYSICAVGGGPGTEVLGLTNLLLTSFRDDNFSIQFSFADRLTTWQWLQAQMIAWAQEALGTANTNHSISPNGTYELDLLNKQGVQALDRFVESVDLFVFNYVLSENKHNFAQIEISLQELIARAKAGCHFLVIDRLESDGRLIDEIMRIFRSNLSTQEPFAYKYKNSVLDSGYLLRDYRRSFGYHPRLRLHTKEGDYGAFSVFGKKGEEDIPF